MADCLGKNDGGLFLLNDGTSCILLNSQTSGVQIEGQHGTASVLRIPRRQKLINVFFTFQLISRLTHKTEIQILDFARLLKKEGIYSESLRNSFRLPMSGLMNKLEPLIKKLDEKNITNIVTRTIDLYGYDYIISKAMLKKMMKKVKEWKKRSQKQK